MPKDTYALNTKERPAPVKWWVPDVPSAEFARLREKRDQPGIRNFALWTVLLLVSGLVAFVAWPTLWSVPAFLVYGTIYSSSDARWHELSHGTVFASSRLTRFWHEVCSFMTIREIVCGSGVGADVRSC